MYLEGILLSISSLLDEPAIEDPLVPEIAAQYLKDKAVYDEIAVMYTRKYAHGKLPILLKNVTRAIGASWQSKFVCERLLEMQRRATALIQVLKTEPEKLFDFDGELGESEPQYQGMAANFLKDALAKYMNLLFQLSSEMAVLSQTFDDKITLRDIVTSNFGQLEIFFDSCAGEFRAFVTSQVWRQAFPLLPHFGNDTTRGTGQGHTYEFLNREYIPRRRLHLNDEAHDPIPSRIQMVALLRTKTGKFVAPWLKRLEGLIQEARLLNADLEISPGK